MDLLHGPCATRHLGGGCTFALFITATQYLPHPRAAAQQGPVAPEVAAFEVASIRVSGSRSVRGSEGGPGSKDPGRYVFNVASLGDLIAVAWNIRGFQLFELEATDRERFDLAVKIPRTLRRTNSA